LAALPSDLTAVTRSLDTRFLRPAGVGEIVAKARIRERTDNEIVVDAALTDQRGVTVAEATARLRILRKP
jgi:acyl-coenzyme A thioesterase PaaI-like protein